MPPVSKASKSAVAVKMKHFKFDDEASDDNEFMSFSQNQSSTFLRKRRHASPTSSFSKQGSSVGNSQPSSKASKSATPREGKRLRQQFQFSNYATLTLNQRMHLETHSMNQNVESIRSKFSSIVAACADVFKFENLHSHIKTLNFASIVSALNQAHDVGFHAPQQQMTTHQEFRTYPFHAEKKNINECLKMKNNCRILEGLQVYNGDVCKRLIKPLTDLFKPLQSEPTSLQNLFLWESQTDGYGPFKPRFTFGAQDSIKGASRQTMDAATLIMVFPQKKVKQSQESHIMNLQVFKTDKTPKIKNALNGDALQNALMKNGSGNRFLLDNHFGLDTYKICEGDLFLVPLGHSFQWHLNCDAMVMQIPFYPLKDDLSKAISKNTVHKNPQHHQVFKGSTIFRRFQNKAFSEAQGATFNGDVPAADVDPDEEDKYKRSMQKAVRADYQTMMRKEVEANEKFISAFRGYQNKTLKKNIVRVQDSEFQNYCGHCQSYIETIALVVLEANLQVWYHINCCKKLNKKKAKLVFRDFIYEDFDITSEIALLHSLQEPLASSLNLSTSLQIFNEAPNLQFEDRSLKGLPNRNVACGLNAVAQLLACANSIPKLQDTYVGFQDNAEVPLFKITDYINGYLEEYPPQWFNELPPVFQNSETDVIDILRHVYKEQLEHKMFSIGFECRQCSYELQEPDITSILEPIEKDPQGITALRKSAIAYTSQASCSVEGYFKSLMEKRASNYGQQECKDCHHMGDCKIVPDLRENLTWVDDNTNLTYTSQNNIIFIDLLKVSIDSGSMKFSKFFKINDIKYEFRGVILQTTEEGGHFVTLGHPPSNYTDLYFRNDLEVKFMERPNSFHLFKNINDISQQYLPSVAMYQQFEWDDAKKNLYRSGTCFTWRQASEQEKQEQIQSMKKYTARQAGLDNDILPNPEYPAHDNITQQVYRTGRTKKSNGEFEDLPQALQLLAFEERKMNQMPDLKGTKICSICNLEEIPQIDHMMTKCSTCGPTGGYYGIPCLVLLARRMLFYQKPEYYCIFCGKNLFEDSEQPLNQIIMMMKLHCNSTENGVDQNQQFTGLPSVVFSVIEKALTDLPRINLHTSDPQQAQNTYHSVIYRSYHDKLLRDLKVEEQGCLLKYWRAPPGQVTQHTPICNYCDKQLKPNFGFVQLRCGHIIDVVCFYELMKAQRHFVTCPVAKCKKEIKHPICVELNIVSKLSVDRNTMPTILFTNWYLFMDIFYQLEFLQAGVLVADFEAHAQQAAAKKRQEKLQQQQLGELLKQVNSDNMMSVMQEIAGKEFNEQLEFVQQVIRSQEQ